jgi:hypothetical protein
MVGDNGSLQELGEVDDVANGALVRFGPVAEPDLGVLLQEAIVLRDEGDDLLSIGVEANGDLSSCERAAS